MRTLMPLRLVAGRRLAAWCSSSASGSGDGTQYQVEMVTNKRLDATTLYQLDKYSRSERGGHNKLLMVVGMDFCLDIEIVS